MNEVNLTNSVTDEELTALRSLKLDDWKTLIAGGSVTTESGVTFTQVGDGASVAGSQVGVLVANHRSQARVDYEQAHREAVMASEQVREQIDKHSLPQEFIDALTAYSEAQDGHVNALHGLIREAEAARDRAATVASGLPAATQSAFASARARMKHRNDPKQAAKVGALQLWNERNSGEHPTLRRVQDFATEVMRRWPILRNAKTIEGWSAKWTKQVKAGKTPTC